MLDFNNVLLTFAQMSGCDTQRVNSEIPLVESAIYQIESIVDEQKIQPADYRRCEYAAACTAVYEFVCQEACRERIITDFEGKAVAERAYDGSIAAAQRLKISALNAIGGILKDNDFLFKTMEVHHGK